MYVCMYVCMYWNLTSLNIRFQQPGSQVYSIIAASSSVFMLLELGFVNVLPSINSYIHTARLEGHT